MDKIAIAFLLSMFYTSRLSAQSESAIIDSVQIMPLQEVTVSSQRTLLQGQNNSLATIDNYLEKLGPVNMIRRGAYAWEPFINGMASERSVVTVDGMRIYGACTDKMDPITSYVEITNLSTANVHSGQSGSGSGATIAGSMDLVRRKTGFGKKQFTGMAFAGFETNNRQKILGSRLSYSRKRFFSDIDVTFRDADNYRAGGGKEILYSPFTKTNMSLITGYQLSEHQHIEASLIYDHATNVGYPALPMDVSLAKAFIGSVEYVRHHLSPSLTQWRTKIYYNNVTHIMDDTKRPVVPIRMDMPGWSKTAGFYSLLEGRIPRHKWKVNISGHQNHSLAEMTMYSNNPGEKDMFMLTWPGVQTSYLDVFLEDAYKISDVWTATISGGIGLNNNNVKDSFGLQSLQIFYPDMQASKTRLLKRVSSAIRYSGEQLEATIGLGYGERAPGVSEGYGFYLFNSFDRFDYIGNPNMKNEQSLELNTSVSREAENFDVKLSGSFFYLKDYIIGVPASGLSVMTIGANGVKIYEQLPSAYIFNSNLNIGYRLSDRLKTRATLTYRRGFSNTVGSLPLMQPLTYTAGIQYLVEKVVVDVNLVGAIKQDQFNPAFGETSAPDYIIFNAAVARKFSWSNKQVTLKTGVDNIFDRYYTTFADWNRLPRMGRNIFASIIWTF